MGNRTFQLGKLFFSPNEYTNIEEKTAEALKELAPLYHAIHLEKKTVCQVGRFDCPLSLAALLACSYLINKRIKANDLPAHFQAEARYNILQSLPEYSIPAVKLYCRNGVLR